MSVYEDIIKGLNEAISYEQGKEIPVKTDRKITPCYFSTDEIKKDSPCYCENLSTQSELKDDCVYYLKEWDMNAWFPYCKLKHATITESIPCVKCNKYVKKSIFNHEIWLEKGNE